MSRLIKSKCSASNADPNLQSRVGCDHGLVWFVTGCSSGLGHTLAETVLQKGARVVVSSRRGSGTSELVRRYSDRALALKLDVTDQQEIQAAVRDAVHHFGRVDVLVNNAGYGYQSSVEEGLDIEIRQLFDTDVFGLFALTRQILPLMRMRGTGHIVNITSLAGLAGSVGRGYYAAAKHAIEGWSDALAAEVSSLGIRVTCVEPGPVRTSWAGRSLRTTPCQIKDYAATVGEKIRSTENTNGSQMGDPYRVAKAIFDLTEMANPPQNLALGRKAVKLGVERLTAKLDDINAWKVLGESTDYPEQNFAPAISSFVRRPPHQKL